MTGLALLCLKLCFSTVLGAIGQNGLNDVAPFNCKDKPRISRFPDRSDCTKFIYCISGSAHSAKCWPEGSRFNPKSTRCDLPPDAECGAATTTTTFTTTTTTQPTTTAKPLSPTDLMIITSAPFVTSDPNKDDLEVTTTTTTPKPPLLTDRFEFDLDCSKNPCGLYPNHEGPCSTYILCSSGVKSIKKCNGGQHFDTLTSECKPPEEATCWEEPDNGSFLKSPPLELCTFHNYSQDSNGSEVTLHSPEVTNWGQWQSFQYCPEGHYISGVNAWRRLLKSGTKTDHAGLVSLGFQCSTPEGVTSPYVELVAPGAPNDPFQTFYTCPQAGKGVGFLLNSLRDQGPWPGDNLATDNLKLICSCGGQAYKPYESIPGEQSGNRGEWTEPQVCGARHSLCGVQTQMADYREGVIGQYDNTGLNNIRAKCCSVPDPSLNCTPKETLLLLRKCGNTQGIYPRRCDFGLNLGIGYSSNENSVKAINFYESIGYSLNDDVGTNLRNRFLEEAPNSLYSWEDADPKIFNFKMNSTIRAIYLKVNSSVEIYQVVGTCSHFILRTNRFMRNLVDFTTGNVTMTYFDV